MLANSKHQNQNQDPPPAVIIHRSFPLADNIDTQWFKDRFADKQLSLRGVAKLMEMSPSSLSLRINGGYKISMDEASDLARLLGVTFDEVVRRAGIRVPRESVKAVKVVGTIGADGKIKKATGETVARPPGLQGEVCALRGVEGWLYFYNPTERLDPDAVGHLAMVQTPSGAFVGTLKRGSERGLWTVVPPFTTPLAPSKSGGEGGLQGGVSDVRGVSATPILMILP